MKEHIQRVAYDLLKHLECLDIVLTKGCLLKSWLINPAPIFLEMVFVAKIITPLTLKQSS